MAANSNVISEITGLTQARELLLQQDSVYQREELIAALDRVPSPLAASSIEELIAYFRENVLTQDYLGRSGATEPIDQPLDVPPIYKALKILIDIAVNLHEKNVNLDTIIEVGMKDALLRMDEIGRASHYRNYLKKEIKRYRVSLLTGPTENPEDFARWKDLTMHFHPYPRALYCDNRPVVDLLDIDLILRQLHFCTQSLKDAVYDCNAIIKPGFVCINDNFERGVQYDPATKLCQLLDTQPFEVADRVRAGNRGRYPVALCATRISSCHVVIARDSQNRIFMLHVSPTSVTGGSSAPGGFFGGKEAYSELIKTSRFPELGLRDDTLDIVVVDREGYFNLAKLTRVLSRGKLGINRFTTHWVTFKPDEIAQTANDYPYNVCYFPESDKLVIVSALKGPDAIEINGVFAKSPSPEPVADDPAYAQDWCFY